jgi:hypothetical protein
MLRWETGTSQGFCLLWTSQGMNLLCHFGGFIDKVEDNLQWRDIHTDSNENPLVGAM